MVSELATNAVVHALSEFEICIERSKKTLFVSTVDCGAGSPAIRTPRPSEMRGRGLQIVRPLSDEWGTSPGPDKHCKTVWFRMDLEHGRAVQIDVEDEVLPIAYRRILHREIPPDNGNGQMRAKGVGRRLSGAGILSF
jgi:hypothetical protein